MPSLRLRCAAVALVALVALPGCSDLDKASASGLSRNDLVADLAAQLAGTGDLTFEATYQLTGGKTGTIAQVREPAGTAYVYPGGKVLVTAAAITSCTTTPGPVTCTLTAPATATSPPPAAIFRGATNAGMVMPDAVQTALNRASLDPDISITQRDTTIAGRHATCVKLDGFDTCITTDGLLGSFTGLLGAGRADVAMTHYSEQVSADTFELPAGAKIIDHRKN
ncbi:hypothetical protein [Winogradskya humida]|uniref:Lipoprotein n=1 Tax=Winogradskya humida TaxID=113566 RepID=A0ABQ3ZK85_9ACTN|nr:hypothetical protein [Actinoplanes humidus]GIE19008.1 hypothetical protein Ahu01nite_021100 [Actinoplanes humidus]